jgi:hypothetical protein
MHETIKKYSEIESLNYLGCSYLPRSIFKPIAHAKAGESVDINNEAELPFFCDTNQTGRARFVVENLMKGLTEDEFQLLKLVASKVFSRNRELGQAIAPISSLLMHLYQKRLIAKTFPSARQIFTVGPGSGYLELLLAMDSNNYTIFTTDVNKAFYLFQIYLYSAFGKLNETFESNPPLRLLDQKINHIPWWHFKDFNTSKPQIKTDLIVCNHAICEMHPLAVRHLLSVAEKHGNPPFLLEGTGAQGTQSTMNEVILIFRDYNYFQVATPIPDAFVFVASALTSKRGLGPVYNKFKRLIPFLNSIEKEAFRIKSEIKNSFLRIKGTQLGQGTVFMDEIMDYYQNLCKTTPYENPDERFLSGIRPKNCQDSNPSQ